MKHEKELTEKNVGKVDNALYEMIGLLWKDYLSNHKDERQKEVPSSLDKFVKTEKLELDDLRPLTMKDNIDNTFATGGFPEIQITKADIDSPTEEEKNLNDALNNINIRNIQMCDTKPVDNFRQEGSGRPLYETKKEIKDAPLNTFEAYKVILNNLNSLIKHFLELQDFDEVAQLTNFAVAIKYSMNKGVAKDVAMRLPVVREKDDWNRPTLPNIDDVIFRGKKELGGDSLIDNFIERLEKVGFLKKEKPVRKTTKKKNTTVKSTKKLS